MFLTVQRSDELLFAEVYPFFALLRHHLKIGCYKIVYFEQSTTAFAHMGPHRMLKGWRLSRSPAGTTVLYMLDVYGTEPAKLHTDIRTRTRAAIAHKKDRTAADLRLPLNLFTINICPMKGGGGTFCGRWCL